MIDSSSLKCVPNYTDIKATVTIPKNKSGETTIQYECFMRVINNTNHCSMYINGMHWSKNTTSPGATISGDLIEGHTFFLRKGDVIKKYSYYGYNNENDGTVKYILIGIK